MSCGRKYPLSFSELNLDCRQETGSVQARCAANMVSVKTRITSQRVEPFCFNCIGLVFPMVLLAGLCMNAPGLANAAVVLTAPHTTMVVFADHPLAKGEWPLLFGAIREGLVEAAAETLPVDVAADLIQGDALAPGLRVESAVSVFLHGDCDAGFEPPRGYPAGAALGSVRLRAGTIEPFVHVDCTAISQVLEPAIYWLSRDQRIHAVAGAIARVILHEWIHIATQSAAHGEHGVTKAHFGIDDLLSERDRLLTRLRGSR